MKSDGTRRLSILMGMVSSLSSTVLILSLGPTLPVGPAKGLLIVVLLVVLGFFVGWGAVRLVAWAMEGFRQDNMEKKRGTTLAVGVAIFALVGVFPPWEYTFNWSRGNAPIRVSKPAGYAPIFLPPQPEGKSELHGVRLDFGRLGIQWALVSAITASIMATQRRS